MHLSDIPCLCLVRILANLIEFAQFEAEDVFSVLLAQNLIECLTDLEVSEHRQRLCDELLRLLRCVVVIQYGLDS